MAFTQEELAAMERADAEIEKDFAMTDQERREARERDRENRNLERDPKARKNAERCLNYYYKHREDRLAKVAVYHKEHAEEISKRKKRYYRKNRETIRAEARERHRADPEKRRARDRENYRKNREAVLTRNKRWRDRAKAERSAIGGNEHD